MSARWRRHRAALILFGLLSLVYVHPVLSGQQLSSFQSVVVSTDPIFDGTGYRTAPVHNPLLYDPEHVFKPDLLEARRQLRAGHLPLWTTAPGTGRPLLASQQFAPFFPTRAIQLVGSPSRLAAVTLALTFLLAALGAYLLALELGLRTSPALLAGTAFGFGPYFTAWAQHPHADVWLLLPLSLIAGQRLARRPGARPALGLAVVGGLELLAGHPQSVLLQAPVTAAWIVFQLLGRGREERRMGAVALWTSVAVVWAVALGAVMAFPFLDGLRDTIGASRGNGFLGRDFLWSVALPDLWGTPPNHFTVGPANFAERTVFVGALPLLFALVAAPLSRIRDRRFFAWTGGVAILIVLDAPIIGAVHTLPPLDEVNVGRLSIVVVFSLSMLAAFGLDALVDATPAQRRRAARIAGVLACVPLLGILAGAGFASEMRWLGPAAATIVLIARPVPWLAVAVAILGVAWLGAGYHGFETPEAASPARPAVIDAAQAVARTNRIIGAGGALTPNLSERFGVRDPAVHDHPPLGRYGLLVRTLHAGTPVRSLLPVPAADAGKFIDLTSVGAVILPPDTARPAGTRVDASVGANEVLSNPGVLPRAFIAGETTPTSSRRTAAALIRSRGTGELRRAPVVEGSMPVPSPAAATGTAAIVDDDGGRMEVRTNAPAAGVLVVTDAYAPGWKAEVDGRPTGIAPANLAFRAVAVPAGRHTVVMRYSPAAALVGAWVSGLAWLATLGLVLMTAMIRHRAPHSQALRLARCMSRRPAPAAMVVLLAFAGAALGAVLAPAGSDRHRAEAAIAIRADQTGRTAPAWRTLATVLHVPAVLQAIRSATGSTVSSGTLAGRLESVGDPGSGLLRIRARGPSQAEAKALADAAARIAVDGADKTLRISLIPSGVSASFAFDRSTGGWDRTGNTFPSPPAVLRLTPDSPYAGAAALRFRCAPPADDCGPAVSLRGRFEPLTAYHAEARVRSASGAPVRVRIVLGSSPPDVHAGPTVTVGRRWKLITTAWTPARPALAAELAVQTASDRTVDVDAASVFDRHLPPAAERRQRAAAVQARARSAEIAGTFSVIAPASAVARASAHTARSSLVGSLMGLLAGLFGLGSERAARRRKAEHEPDADLQPVSGEVGGEDGDAGRRENPE